MNTGTWSFMKMNTLIELGTDYIRLMAAMLLGMLLVFKVSTLFGKRDEVGEGHPTKADMVERINGAGLNVLGMVIIQASADSFLQVIDGEHWFEMRRQIFHFQTFDLVVEILHRH